MEQMVLVAYASKHGSTKEIAEHIAAVLGRANLSVEVKSADEIEDIASYRAVILGSAVYAGAWCSEAVELLETQEAKLAQRPTWFFSSGPTGESDPVALLDGWRFPTAQQAIADRIGPRDTTVFHGKIDTNKLNFAERLMIKAVKAQVGDFRNWDAIDAWANGIAQSLVG